jgi:hypothetical protein
VFEIIDEAGLSHIISVSKWRRFAWRIPEAQGSDLSGNLFGARVNKNDIRVMKSSAFLRMLVVVIDRELKLA